MQKTVTFGVSFKGKETGADYIGTFEAKTSTSYREDLKEDEIRRNVLGVNSVEAGGEAAAVAQAYAYLLIRVVKSPDWWKACGFGLDSEDPNILSEINNRTVAEIAKARESVVKAAEAELPQLQKKLDDENK